jgi:hypothetical protein
MEINTMNILPATDLQMVRGAHSSYFSEALSLAHQPCSISNILGYDYGCFVALFIVGCVILTLLVYLFRRHYPDMHIWP